jgi:hypothetical protein
VERRRGDFIVGEDGPGPVGGRVPCGYGKARVTTTMTYCVHDRYQMILDTHGSSLTCLSVITVFRYLFDLLKRIIISILNYINIFDVFCVNKTLALKETTNSTKHLKKNENYNEIFEKPLRAAAAAPP